jgi:hypothetical protein
MADDSSPIQFEDIPIDEARRMGGGPRMDPQLYQELRTRIPRLSSHAIHITIPEGTSPITMKNRILGVAAELRIPVTIRKVTGGLLSRSCALLAGSGCRQMVPTPAATEAD